MPKVNEVTFHNDGTCSITRRSPWSGIANTIRVKALPEQFLAWERGGALIQEAFPELTADEREFILTGITGEEWDRAFQDPNRDSLHD